MPPKKKVEEKKVLLGRPGNNLKAGIVGLANVGKSTFFQAITKSPLGNPANYPFATIDPEEARVIVPSPRFDALAEIYKPASLVPAHLTVYDIAGLTKGASAGEGLGNAFLSHIRSVDSIYQVVRCFDDAEIIHIEGDVDPIRDLQIINEELRLKDIEFSQKALENAEKIARRGGQSLEVKQKKEEAALIERIIKLLEDGQRVANQSWAPKEVEVINSMFLLTAKPCIYLINLSERDYIRKKNKHLLKIKEWVDKYSPGDIIIPFSVCLEERLATMSPEEQEEELKNIGTQSALPKIITTMRKKLELISFFTCGPDEVREWTVREGTKAPQAAGVIHNDLMNTFILAQVMKYPDVIEYKDDNAIKSAGKLQQKGKDYVVEDGDIIYFRAAAGKN
ncbi:OLA1 (YBR025C) [Zygosaccharomyces parabailii]|uniref:Obg-like ATPase 1 n=1 Tax=Zygosaccharomyces bailii (strain CLIB 213 / ATCC 58445 / CBS 680 / BCRC 21525 / NBRC 1098 / NCYC 1416 / NRRL Y-2227) TaxID=1333698 RepID=A0A8J2T6A0_ZYGB2|nr:OLA1 (YBR025C) [Zygosaccharomyces parabailii]CDF89047.1 ZYBA0S03-07932g1_1 [Zygosaccharomyces bailii CLIB 213]CDH10278.1 probable GTP-binding protein [Zygosaccharomyces bailii ISA1307]SJM83228.1 Ola1p [Zygosaccharomyces bailii]AQZ17701.1 OLA1 (YBR025C) [Zygosaccharomyces parabailii]